MFFQKAEVYPILYACLFNGTMILAYVVAVCTEHVSPFLPFVSETATVTPESCIFALGITITSMAVNIYFPTELMHTTHVLAAGSFVLCSTIREIMQTTLSFILYPIIGRKSLNIFRMFISVILIGLIAAIYQCADEATLRFDGTLTRLWKPEEGGYDYHAAGAIAEYLTIIIKTVYWATFVVEFKYLEIRFPKLINKQIED